MITLPKPDATVRPGRCAIAGAGTSRLGQVPGVSSLDLTIEAIANEVGYEDAGFFGRLFRRNVNLTPAQYRKRFGSLRRALSGDG